ncbi:beta-galactosidase [Anaeromicropila populeti]|uniref:Beta-galactosidase n=1 Tax=Anaeromicropila populeti TaxID=37658 RepID=A0A1I6L6Y2_9FIRM|nr:beta-galactosidase [Anaeromicropila populeti]SFR99020.1 beta-galactosidase [Anaeromicropila populeti]
MYTVCEKEGIFYVDGKKEFLICADYPYYRDKVDNWEDRLNKLKQGNVSVVTCYIPWRHHEIHIDRKNVIDFEGKTKPNRNLKYFLTLCKSAGLYVILKPGPFIHAEVNYGGLPDFVNPEKNPSIPPMLDWEGKPITYEHSLPAPYGEKYKGMVEKWYQVVNHHILEPFQYPNGSVIAVQIFNEGIYSNANCFTENYDYSPDSLVIYDEFLQKKYGTIYSYNLIHNTEYDAFSDIKPPVKWNTCKSYREIMEYYDWSDYQGTYLSRIYSYYADKLTVKIPFFANINAPLEGNRGLDAWITRVRPEELSPIVYGYTSWVGVVSHDEDAYSKFLVLAKRKRGPNLEGNWGFSKLYDSKFKYPVIPFYQTVLSIALGATGYNIYTGVGTAEWDENVDCVYERPYPDSSPISSKGELTEKYYVMKLLNTYMKAYGREILESSTRKCIAYGMYTPDCYLPTWKDSIENLMELSLYQKGNGTKGLECFQRNVRRQNYDYAILELQYCTEDELQKQPVITIAGVRFMSASVQRKLVSYVKKGGRLIVIGNLPVLDETLNQCEIVKKELLGHKVIGTMKKAKADGFSEELNFVQELADIKGIILYTSEGKPFAYKNTVEQGEVFYIGAGLFADESKKYSEIFLDLLQKVISSYDVSAYNPDTQVWCYHHPSGIKQIFILSRAEEAFWHKIEVKNHKGTYDLLSIKLPGKSAAIVRLEQEEITAFIAKGRNELTGKGEGVELSFHSYKYKSSGKTKDILMIDGKMIETDNQGKENI